MLDNIENLKRQDLLASIAELYFVEELNQAQIAKQIGVTRSMVSRMLTEARRLGIVKITINRPISYDRDLQDELIECFGLRAAWVVSWRGDNISLLQRLGAAGAHALKPYLKPNLTLGIPWGRAVSAVIDELEFEAPIPIKVVQLMGALGARNNKIDGHAVVQRLAEKLGGEAYYLNAPFMMDTEEAASTLRSNPSIKDTLMLTEHCDLALLGVGGTTPQNSSYLEAGYLKREELDELIAAGAVGGVCSIHFNAQGKPVADEFEARTMGISRQALWRIPLRVGVAGGIGKVLSILGAMRGGYINALITDSGTATQILTIAGHLTANPADLDPALACKTPSNRGVNYS